MGDWDKTNFNEQYFAPNNTFRAKRTFRNNIL